MACAAPLKMAAGSARQPLCERYAQVTYSAFLIAGNGPFLGLIHAAACTAFDLLLDSNLKSRTRNLPSDTSSVIIYRQIQIPYEFCLEDN